MAEPELIEFVRKHIKDHGADALRKQLLQDGVAPEDIEEALVLAAAPPTTAVPRRKGRLGRLALMAGGALLGAAALMSLQKGKHPPAPPAGPEGGQVQPPGDPVFRGHYGYLLKLPNGYSATASFKDPGKTIETVYLYPTGTNPTHFIHEGLFGQLGIMRLEVAPRRVPQGLIGLETLQAWVTAQLRAEKSAYQNKPLNVNGMPGFLISVSEPFTSAKAYLVGQKVYYVLLTGKESPELNDLISSLAEVAPHDNPGK